MNEMTFLLDTKSKALSKGSKDKSHSFTTPYKVPFLLSSDRKENNMKNIKVWRDKSGLPQEQVIAEGTYQECVRAGERYIIDHPDEQVLVDYRLELVE